VAELIVGLVATPQQWRRDLHAHVRDHVAGVRLVVLHESTEAFTAGVDVVIVDDTMEFLTPTQALALRDQGVRVVGVYDPKGKAGRGRAALDVLGVDSALDVTSPPEKLLATVATLSPARAGARGPITGSTPAVPGHANGHQPGMPGPPQPLPGGHRLATIAVAGGSDAPGRTETAVALAASLAARAGPTLLVDLDEHSPTVARRLGFHVAPNVLDALGAVQSGVPLPSVVGQRAAFAPGQVGFNVVCGLANPNEWAQLRDVRALLRAAVETWAYVVVDTGPTCAPDQVPPGGTRNSATRTALRSADHVVAVCNPTPLGVLRLLDWATSAVELAAGRPMTVLVNRAPTDRYARDQLYRQIAGNLPQASLWAVDFLPVDPKVTQAVWDADVVRPGGFTAGVDRFATHLLPGLPAARKARRSLLGGRP
jgi:MinD-like ATPase involved in chromosome partitioning or flagellar assembly